jgi:hypothetical protein
MDNIKMHVEIKWERVDWIHVAQDRDNSEYSNGYAGSTWLPEDLFIGCSRTLP